jgi:acyl carrier protein phosphodiesterase
VLGALRHLTTFEASKQAGLPLSPTSAFIYGAGTIRVATRPPSQLAKLRYFAAESPPAISISKVALLLPAPIIAPLNYLAHLLLAESHAASRVGNLLGDFVPGRPESLRGSFPDAVLHGIVRHRAIDRFTDSHRITLSLKAFIDPKRRRFAGVITDILHDHFLTRHWDGHCDVPLAEFTAACNAALREHAAILPLELRDTLEERIADNWLGRYGTEEGLDQVFQRVSRRNPGFAPIHDAIDDLTTHREIFEKAFHGFFPDLRQWVRALGPEADALI